MDMTTAPFLVFALVFAVSVTVFLRGLMSHNDDITIPGVLATIATIVAILAWTHGAKWQRDDINLKYFLTPKTQTL